MAKKKKRARKAARKKKKTTTRKKAARKKTGRRSSGGHPKYPRHSLEKVLRIPRAILDQNAGKACTGREAADFVGVGWAGPFQVEISSALKFGLLDRPSTGKIGITDVAKQILRPQKPQDELEGLRQAVLKAPEISDVYSHYRGENLPDKQFFENALVDTFKIPQDKLAEFMSIFVDTLRFAKLLEGHNGKRRVIDAASGVEPKGESTVTLKKLEKSVTVKEGDACFVMMPFAAPIGDYYASVYEPAIQKAGLKAVRADDDIFGTGKIMDQIWTGIRGAKVLVAELTTRNPNVLYELGLAHALEKPVVLVASDEQDVPFDLGHIRVIYYDQNDPFWGAKLIDKVAENILSAISNPEEAIFKIGSE